MFKEIKEAGIELILIKWHERDQAYDDILYSAYLEPDYYEEGQKAARGLLEYLSESGQSGREINIVELSGQYDVPDRSTSERTKGFSDEIANAENLKIVDSQDGSLWDRFTAREDAMEFIHRYEKLDVLFVHNGHTAVGIAEAIEESGDAEKNNIIIFSTAFYDYLYLKLETLESGGLQCLVESSPLIGDKLMEACVKLSKGEIIEKRIPQNVHVLFQKDAREHLENYQKIYDFYATVP